jgi:hypothetical protein
LPCCGESLHAVQPIPTFMKCIRRCRGEKIDGSSLVTYGTTKLMNVMTAREFQRRLGDDAGVLNFVVHPGKLLNDFGCPEVRLFSNLTWLLSVCSIHSLD